jgi:spermidine synthase
MSSRYARRLPSTPDSERFSVLHGDAADFLRHNTSTYDVLLLDGFDANGVPPQLDTPQFYSDCQRALSPGGVLVSNVHACNSDYLHTLERIQNVFGEAPLVVPCGQGSNHLAFAIKGHAAPLQTFYEVRCPTGFDPGAWKSLLPSLARVALTSRSRFVRYP